MRDAVSLATNLQLEQVLFESDCLELVQAYRGENMRGEIQSIIQDINHMKIGFRICGFTWVQCRGNQLAH